MVDIARSRSTARNWSRMPLVVLLGASAVWGADSLRRLAPAAMTVSETVVLGTVTRGDLVREVAGQGPLVPLQVTVITTEVGGQVVDVPLEPGTEVEPGAVLIVMKDPAVERRVTEARRALRSAEAERNRLELLLEQSELDLRAALAQALAAWQEKNEDAEMKEQLANRGYVSGRDYRLARAQAERLLTLLELQVARVENLRKTNRIQLQDKQDTIARAEEELTDRQHELEALTVRAAVGGVLQELGPSLVERWEVGQRIAAGTRVAKITDPAQLKAVIEVPDVQAREVMLGQEVVIDTRTAEVQGRVLRIDPAVREGRVAIDVELPSELPPGARPDLEVFGRIQIEQLRDVLRLSPRPGLSQPNTTVNLFRLATDGTSAARVAVRLGRASLNAIEVVDGLAEGDRVIVSDMSRYEAMDRISLPQ